MPARQFHIEAHGIGRTAGDKIPAFFGRSDGGSQRHARNALDDRADQRRIMAESSTTRTLRRVSASSSIRRAPGWRFCAVRHGGGVARLAARDLADLLGGKLMDMRLAARGVEHDAPRGNAADIACHDRDALLAQEAFAEGDVALADGVVIEVRCIAAPPNILAARRSLRPPRLRWR